MHFLLAILGILVFYWGFCASGSVENESFDESERSS